ncbi:MAG: BrnT family toxin [Deltaproteobacteria bacterium]|nr:BrnT family toxin [Deltaproteobacteria bacterium]
MKRRNDILLNLQGFEWDKGNLLKNWEKHNVSHMECEEVFFRAPLLVKSDETHSQTEDRYYLLGKTDNGRLLFMVITIRAKKIRVISARDMSKRERKVYEEAEKNPQIQE